MDEPPTPSARPVLDYAPAPDRIGRKIFRSLLLIAIVLPTGAIGAGIAYLLEPATYTPTGFLAVNMPAGSADANVNLMTQFKRAHAASLVKLARKMQIDARIRPLPQQKLIAVEVSGLNASEAARFVNNLMDADKLAASPGTVQIAHRASNLVIGHRQPLIPLAGFFGGLLIAIIGLLAFRKNSKAVTDPMVVSPL